MRVEFEFYGTLRDAVGQKTVVREVEEGTTGLEATRAVADEYETVESLLFRSNGEVRPNVTVSVNGDPILDADDDVTLEDGDELVLAPGIAGGVTVAAATGAAGR
jgi:molybdopterin synthase sulfur carrier subunit